MPLTQQEIDTSIKLVIDTFKEVRPELMQYYGNVEHVSKDNDSPVTELDVKVETILKQKLAEQFPHIGFRGEETDSVEGSSGAMWVVDPIDGTSCFIHGLPFCTNMAGLVVDGEPVAGIIYEFVTDTLYTAKKGDGAYKNSDRMSIKNQPLNNSVVFASAAAFTKTYKLLGEYKVNSFAPIGASGYYYNRLAEGNIQGVMKLRAVSQVHDNVPGVLIAKEAGAETLSFEGEDYKYDTLQFVIGTPNFIEMARERKSDIENSLKI